MKIPDEAEEKTTHDEINTSKDKYILGLHLYLGHQIDYPDAFDQLIKFGIEYPQEYLIRRLGDKKLVI